MDEVAQCFVFDQTLQLLKSPHLVEGLKRAAADLECQCLAFTTM